MAARKKVIFHPDEVKRRIQTSQLINRLTAHALSETPLMDGSQVQAARALINKVIPDAQKIEVEGSLSLTLPTTISLIAGDDSSGPATA